MEKIQRSDYTTDPLTQGTLMTFDQTEFFGGAFANIGLDDEGYIFVPNQCADRSVRKYKPKIRGSIALYIYLFFFGVVVIAELV